MALSENRRRVLDTLWHGSPVEFTRLACATTFSRRGTSERTRALLNKMRQDGLIEEAKPDGAIVPAFRITKAGQMAIGHKPTVPTMH